MSSQKNIGCNQTGWIITVVILVLFIHVSILHAGGRLLAWPINNEKGISSKYKISLQPHEVRKGHIALAPEILPKATRSGGSTVSKGDTVAINLFADVAYDVTIDSVAYHNGGIKTIRGKLKDHKMGTAVMTIGPDGYLITVQDMKRAILYRAKGNSQSGSGTVTEIDMTKMPPVIR